MFGSKDRTRVSRKVFCVGVVATIAAALLIMVGIFTVVEAKDDIFSASAASNKGPGEAMAGIVDANDANYETLISTGKFVLVEFYASWCVHCINFADTYKSVGARVLEDEDLRRHLIVAKISAPHNKKASDAFNIKSFPTVLLVKPNSEKWKEYEGGRDVQSIMRFLRRNINL